MTVDVVHKCRRETTKEARKDAERFEPQAPRQKEAEMQSIAESTLFDFV